MFGLKKPIHILKIHTCKISGKLAYIHIRNIQIWKNYKNMEKSD